MGVVDQALTDAINGARESQPPAPATLDEAAEWFGPPRAANRAIADRYGVSIREVQRWRMHGRGGPGQKRAVPAATKKQILALARRRQLKAWRTNRVPGTLARIRRRGVEMRLDATLSVYGKPAKRKIMPANAGNRPMYQPIDGGPMGPVLDAWEAGQRALVGDLLTTAFLVAYGIDVIGGEPTEIETVHAAWVRLL